MALTHVFDQTKYAARQVDLGDLKTQLDVATALLDAIINDAAITTAEVPVYLKQLAVIQKRSLKALTRLVVA